MGPIPGAGALNLGSEFSRVLNSVEDVKSRRSRGGKRIAYHQEPLPRKGISLMPLKNEEVLLLIHQTVQKKESHLVHPTKASLVLP